MARNELSEYEAMIPIEEARSIVEGETPVLSKKTVALAECVGRVLAEDIIADMDLPPFDRSQMDGFAIRSEDLTGTDVALKIIGESAAGKGWDGIVEKGTAVRIMTGARVPEGADSVQMVEKTREADGFVTIQSPTRKLENIVKRASEIRSGEKVLDAGTRVTANMIATLASFGYSMVPVGSRPRISILSTGSEIVDIDKKPGPDQIRNSNSWSLSQFARHVNARVSILDNAADNLRALTDIIDRETEKCDLLVISGGVSVGDYDFTKPALEKIGAKIFFDKVALKPGKPTVFAKKADTMIFGLPGNPVSVAVTFFVFVRPAILKMQGARKFGLAKSNAVLSHDINGAKGRDSLLPVTVSVTSDGLQSVETLRFSGSSNFITFAEANALVFVERDTKMRAGELATLYWIS